MTRYKVTMGDALHEGLKLYFTYWHQFAERWNSRPLLTSRYGTLPLRIHSAELSEYDGSMLIAFRGLR